MARPPQAPGTPAGSKNDEGNAHRAGSGTSMGVPTIGCTCAVCHSTDPRDRRTRPSVLIEYAGKVVLIDTTPDFREQAIAKESQGSTRSSYTHSHADHILGIDDLRPLSYHREGKIPLYARAEAAEYIRNMFRYIFDADYKFGGLARLELKPIAGTFDLFGASVEPIPVIHGETEIYGFRLGSAAYLTDFSEFPRPLCHACRDSMCFFWTGCATSAPHPLDRRELHPNCGSSEREEGLLHPHLSRPAHEATNASLPRTCACRTTE